MNSRNPVAISFQFGAMAGVTLFIAKFVLYFMHRWAFRLDMPFLLLSFTGILIGIALAVRQLYTVTTKYWTATGYSLVACATAVILTMSADQILYRFVNPKLAENSLHYQQVMLRNNMAKTHRQTELQKGLIKDLDEAKPEDMYRLDSFLITIPLLTFFYGLFAALISYRYYRRAKGKMLV